VGPSPRWIEVAFGTVFWGGSMLFWTARQRKAANIKPACSYVDVLFWGCAGFVFGLLTTFGWWQSFHRPLVYLILLAFVTAIVLGPRRPAKRSQ
jgi:hypothetical protein